MFEESVYFLFSILGLTIHTEQIIIFTLQEYVTQFCL